MVDTSRERLMEIRENAKVYRIIEALLDKYGSTEDIPYQEADEAMLPFGRLPEFVYSMAEYILIQRKKLH